MLGLALIYAAHLILLTAIRAHLYDEGIVVSEQMGGLSTLDQLRQQAAAVQANFASLFEHLVPFDEIDAFDDDAKDWSNMFSQYMGALLVFDANNDGRLDVYFGQDGQNWTRPTDEHGVLLDEPRYQHNALYLNQGNDADGRPIFAQLSDLVCGAGNDTYVEEELLIEDHLFPRTACSGTQKRRGRQSAVAVAADFNADGRQDLLVGNALPGMLWSHPSTQNVLWQFVSPKGRKARNAKQALTAMGPFLIEYEPRHNRDDRRESRRGMELFGANSLYLNTGDKDGDGLPEWQDVSLSAGIMDYRSTVSLSVADIDLDGDLDFYAGNVMDGDFWPGGSKRWAGGANSLYVNQLAQTGELKFVERGSEMDADGVYDEGFPMPDYYRIRRIPFLPPEYSFLFLRVEPFKPEIMSINGQRADAGQITWATTFQDVNDDGYPDIWSVNDFGYLRLYLNREGQRFTHEPHTANRTGGQWMGVAPADYDGDLEEDMFAGNLGGAIFSHAFGGSDPFDLFDPVMESAVLSSVFINGRHDTRHVIIDGADTDRRFQVRVQHSTVMPPDASLPNNIRELRTLPNGLAFDRDSLDPYEFTWGVTSFDVQNDGLNDFFYHGSLYGRGGGLSSILGTGPGRLFINAGIEDGALRLIDLTAEHHAYNISELEYDRLESDGYVYRRSPTKNWQKRDVVYSYDRSSWTQQGPSLQQHIANCDLIQTAESGRGAIAADLNGDGFRDLLLRNGGGYDSRSSTAKNLKIMKDGRPQVLPAHSYHYPVPTNFEPGSSRLFINRYREKNWLRVRLIDDSEGALNRDAIGAKAIINDRFLRVKRVGDGSFVSNRVEDLMFGLGDEAATSIEVRWPDKARTVSRIDLPSLARGTLTFSKTGGVVDWQPEVADERPAESPRISRATAAP
ncbi:MAG: CRTAC1 family protein [Acidobacteriota bacterium]